LVVVVSCPLRGRGRERANDRERVERRLGEGRFNWGSGAGWRSDSLCAILIA
jgi:hypothetical protein